MDNQATDNIIQLILGERIQKLIYDSGVNLSEASDTKRLGEVLAFIYIGALQHSKDYPETSDIIADKGINILTEPFLFDKGF